MLGAIAWGALGGTQRDHESTKSVPMQRGARSVFCRSVPMQRGARFSFFGDRSMVQHGVDEGVKNIYKINAIMHFSNEVHAVSGHQVDPEEQNLQNDT